jgi:hypothetical protein
MQPSALLLFLPLLWSASHAADTPGKPIAAQSPAQVENSTQSAKIRAVTSAGPGQAGYVHYFVITHPDGDLEYQVGVELEDQRIAWSFPTAGVTVSNFIKRGTINVHDKPFQIEHLHGIRPFANDAEMRLLQKALPQRVAQWVDSDTPYCLLRQPGQQFCLSCGDFVVRILYPGNHPLVPALPHDFLRMTGGAYTTDDLLLYLVGLHNLPDKRSMLDKLATLDLPAVMREDIVSMIEGITPSTPPAAVAVTPPPATQAAQKPAVKPAAGKIAARRQQARKL